MKKYIVALLFGAFLCSTLVATVGCGGDPPKKPAADKKDKADK